MNHLRIQVLSSDIKLFTDYCSYLCSILGEDFEDVIREISDQANEKVTIELDGNLPILSWNQQNRKVIVKKVPVQLGADTEEGGVEFVLRAMSGSSVSWG